MAKVAVLIIHGMGSQNKYFAYPTIVEINNRVKKYGKNPDDIVWKPVYWANLIEPRQKKFVDTIVNHKDNDIDLIKLRRFVVSSLGDATAYQNIKGKKSSTYTEINSHIKACVKDLFDSDLGKQSCPLIVMAHSLGGHIMSCYIWDIQQHPLTSLSDFENMRYLAGMVTFGCNIPLFSFAHKTSDLRPISFPGESLSSTEKAKATWLNFYDPDDILGYPLSQINNRFKFIIDKHINSGGLLTSWSPMSHSGYWTDNDLTKPAAKLIAEFM